MKIANLKFKIADSIIILLELIVLVIFLFWRYKLGITRYFDIDEFAHLHWGYSLFIGERPYTDFFYLFPPFFLYVLAPFFAVLGRSVVVLIQTRVFIYLAFVGSAAILIMLGKNLRSLCLGLLAAIIFVFLPLPLDKMIEVRPDNLATFLALLGLYLFMIGQEKDLPAGRQGQKKFIFLSGLCYSVSLGIVPKTVFFLVPPLLVLGYQLLSTSSKPSSKPGLSSYSKPGLDLLLFFLGGLPAVLLLLGLIIAYGNPVFAVYSMTKMSAAVTAALGAKFYMRPDLFFYQNETYYGLGGYSLPYLSNLVIYIGASLFALLRFISSVSHKDNKKCLREFLVGGTFLVNLYVFVFLYPLKHAQYLTPVAPFIAFYAADLVGSIAELKWLKLVKLNKLIILFVLVFLYFVGQQMYGKKMQWTNKSTLEKTERLLRAIPAAEPVFDLTGESIFFPNGYYFCCLPYGQYEEALLFHLPDLSKLLKERGTKYVYTGQFDRLNVLPALQAKYIRENFVNFWSDGSLLIKK